MPRLKSRLGTSWMSGRPPRLVWGSESHPKDVGKGEQSQWRSAMVFCDSQVAPLQLGWLRRRLLVGRRVLSQQRALAPCALGQAWWELTPGSGLAVISQCPTCQGRMHCESKHASTARSSPVFARFRWMGCRAHGGWLGQLLGCKCGTGPYFRDCGERNLPFRLGQGGQSDKFQVRENSTESTACGLKKLGACEKVLGMGSNGRVLGPDMLAAQRI